MITFIAIMTMVALCVFICIGIAKMWYNTDLEIIKKDYEDQIFILKHNHELEQKHLLKEISQNQDLIMSMEQRLLRELERKKKKLKKFNNLSFKLF